MKTGTLDGLKRNGFPLGVRTRLMMKPNKEIPDLDYKKMAFEGVASLGEVIGVFENEPANINAMRSFFKDSIAVFLDTQHSNKPDVPAEGIYWVKDFR